MPDQIGLRLRKDRCERINVQKVELEKVETRILQGTVEIGTASKEEIVHAEDLVPACKKARNEIRRDESRGASENDAH
jgi:hypothetical protein